MVKCLGDIRQYYFGFNKSYYMSPVGRKQYYNRNILSSTLRIRLGKCHFCVNISKNAFLQDYNNHTLSGHRFYGRWISSSPCKTRGFVCLFMRRYFFYPLWLEMVLVRSKWKIVIATGRFRGNYFTYKRRRNRREG